MSCPVFYSHNFCYRTLFLTSFRAEMMRFLHHNASALQKKSHFEQIPSVALLFPTLFSSHSQLCVHLLGPASLAQQHSCLTVRWHIQKIYGNARFVRIKKKKKDL